MQNIMNGPLSADPNRPPLSEIQVICNPANDSISSGQLESLKLSSLYCRSDGSFKVSQKVLIERNAKHIVVLKGGWSSEREISLLTGSQCAKGLLEAGYRVTEIDVDQNFPTMLLTINPDACFNALHGRFGEDGHIQATLNELGIPYTHSGVQASAIAMDKAEAKRIFSEAGLRCPPGRAVNLQDFANGEVMEQPYVLKPNNEGSSVGVHIVKDGDEYNPLEQGWEFGKTVLVEQFIPGRELTVGVLDGKALCVTEITSKFCFYDYNAKYSEGGSIHLVPATLPACVTAQALDWAERAHRALNCRGVTRCDFRYDDTCKHPGELYLLEINTQPGLTEVSLIPEQAAYCGISFPQLMVHLIDKAQCD